MEKTQQPFPGLNQAYGQVFQPNRLSIGLVCPIEAYPTSAVPTMDRHLERVQLADKLGFAALWLRDVPFNVPGFGDAGQTFDPFVYLGLLSAVTKNTALGVASAILPLRHPAHLAKSAFSADVLSGGRLLLGVASGDRPEEYPAMGTEFQNRGERFRETFVYIRAMEQSYPRVETSQGKPDGSIDMLPKPTSGRVPLLITGGSQQSPDWVAQHGDGWITYPRDAVSQGRVIQGYRRRISNSGGQNKPVMQSLYIDLQDDPGAGPRPIHLGFASGTNFLRAYLREIKSLGINHVALNLRFNNSDIEDTMKRLIDNLYPEFENYDLSQRQET